MHVHRCPIPDRSPSAMFKRLSLTQRLLAGTAFAITLAFGTLLAITVQQSRQSAVEQAELGMRTQLDLVVTMLDYAQDALKTRARDQLTLLEHELPGKASLGAPVATPLDPRIRMLPVQPRLWRPLGIAHRAGPGERATQHVLDVLWQQKQV